MYTRLKRSGLIALLFCLQTINSNATSILHTPTLFNPIPTTTSWKSQRDRRIIKQSVDYSCGAAALATILNLYGKQTTELELLQAINVNDGMTSFEAMARALPSLEFQALDTSGDCVWLGDPSWGNRLLTKQRFLTLWQTQPHTTEGKILVVLPLVGKRYISIGGDKTSFCRTSLKHLNTPTSEIFAISQCPIGQKVDSKNNKPIKSLNYITQTQNQSGN
jgi:hypothetical protein